MPNSNDDSRTIDTYRIHFRTVSPSNIYNTNENQHNAVNVFSMRLKHAHTGHKYTYLMRTFILGAKKTHYIHKISCIINKSNLIILNDKNGSLPVFDVVWCGVVSCIFVGLHAFAIHLVNPAGDGAVS